jgi:putative PIN family toxin of toxin-antitoxin system
VAKSAAPLRLVLDTNIIISGLLWSGAPRQLLDKASDDPNIRLFTSEALINELRTSLGYRKFEKRLSQAGMAIDDAVLLYRGLVEIMVPTPISGVVPRDADDDAVAAVAIAAKAHAIVSGDKDLNSLEQIWGIPVLRPGETLELLNDRARTQPK